MKKRIITIGFLILSLIFSSTSLAQEPLEAYNISNTYFITQKLSIQLLEQSYWILDILG